MSPRIVRAWLPVVLWAAVIWILSTGGFSSDSTSRIILPILRWLLPSASLQTLLLLHHIIRKCAHLAEYSILSVLLVRAIRGSGAGWRWSWGITAIVIASAYAAVDEIHQALVPGRTASPYDSLLDASGVVAAQIVLWLYARRQTRRQARHT